MAKSKQKQKTKVIDFNDYTPQIHKKKTVNIVPRNSKQEELYLELMNNNKKIVFALGPAGTGKSYICTLHAIKMYKEGKIEKILISRPAVENGEKHGFLPGDLNKKMDPWTRPIFDIIEEYYDSLQINMMLEEKIIEIAPLAYLRGRTFKNCIIILDESQLTTVDQMKMFLTRLGDGCRAYITGDVNQRDGRLEGLTDFLQRMQQRTSDLISLVQFNVEHVERSKIVKDVLYIYGDEG